MRLTSLCTRPLYICLLILAAFSGLADADAYKPVYFTFNEAMTLRFEDPAKPDGRLRVLETLPIGSVVEVDDDWKSDAKKFGYFRANGNANTTRFVSDFKVISAPGWSADRLAAINSGPKAYMIRDSVDNYTPSTTSPVAPLPETQAIPVPDAKPKTLVTLNNAVSVRRSDPTKEGRLIGNPGFPTLPKGTVVEVDTSELGNAERFKYPGGTSDFYSGFKVISGPGLSTLEIAALNAEPIYLAEGLVDKGTKREVSTQTDIIDDPSAYNPEPETVPEELLLEAGVVCSGDCPGDRPDDAVVQVQALADLLKNWQPPTAVIQPANKKYCKDDIAFVKSTAPVGKPAINVEDFLNSHKDYPEGAQTAIAQAFAYFSKNISVIKNRKFMTVVDFTAHATTKRMYVINMETGEVERMQVAHGRGSDKEKRPPKIASGTGIFECWDDKDGSLATVRGFHLTGTVYDGQHGKSLRMLALQPEETNSCDRDIVVHRADYINAGEKGRSEGCPACGETKACTDLINKKLPYGSLFYNYTGDKPRCRDIH